MSALTGQSTDIHLLEVLSLQYDNCQLARGRHIAQRETNVSKLVLLICTTTIHSSRFKTLLQVQLLSLLKLAFCELKI